MMLSGLLPDFVLPRISLKTCNHRHIFWWKISFLNEGEIGNKWGGGGEAQNCGKNKFGGFAFFLFLEILSVLFIILFYQIQV